MDYGCSSLEARSHYVVLLGLTVTYACAILAYAQLLYHFQEEQSLFRILYQLLIFIVFPLYPVCTLVTRVAETDLDWRWLQHQNRTYTLCRIFGLHAMRSDGRSEPLRFEHLSQGHLMRRNEGTIMRSCKALALVLISCQCIGTTIWTFSRIQRFQSSADPFRGFVPADFESFWLNIGTLSVLILSWMAYFVNVVWRYDRELGLTVEEGLISRAGILTGVVISFYTLTCRTTLVIALFVESAILSVDPTQTLTLWAVVTLAAITWLIRADAEGLPNGLTVHMSGFWAYLIGCIARLVFYDNVRVGSEGHRQSADYWIAPGIPWPLAISIILLFLRLATLDLLRSRISSFWSVTSHLVITALGTLFLIVLPAYLLTWNQFDHSLHYEPCPDQLLRYSLGTSKF